MEIETVAHTIQVPKESKEVVDALAKVYELAKAKTDLMGYSAAIGDLTKAVEGIDKVDDEVKSKYKGGLAAYFVEKVMNFF